MEVAVQYLSQQAIQLVASLSPQRLRLNLRPILVAFMMNEVAMGQFLPPELRCSLSISSH